MENISILYLVLPLSAILILLFSLFYFARRRRLIREGKEPDNPLPIVKIILVVVAMIIYVYIIKSYELELWQQGIISLVMAAIMWLMYSPEKFKAKLGGKIKRPKISIKWLIVIALLFGVISWDYWHTDTYTFTTTGNIPNYIEVNSGNPVVESGSLVMSQGDKITIKGSQNMNPTRITLVPADDSAELNAVHIIIGRLDASYDIDPAPDGSNPGQEFRVGVIRNNAGEVVSSFFPTVGNLYSNNIIVQPLVLERGSIALPNYKLWAGTGTFDQIVLAKAREKTEKGKGLISIEVKNQKTIKIKEIVVTKGLLVIILELITVWI